MSDSKILNHTQINRKIKRIAFQVYENNFDEKEIIVIGIEPRGTILAGRITAELNSISPFTVHSETLRINKDNPVSEDPKCSFDPQSCKGKTLILVDDVLNTGKTLIYAVSRLLSSEPKSVQTVTLVDRRHRKFPVRADYVGLTLATTLQEHIQVEFGKEDAVWLK